MYHRPISEHNQNHASTNQVIARPRCTGMGDYGSPMLTLPPNRGVINPTNKDITYIYAPPVAPGSLDPRLAGKRTKFNWRVSTHQFF